MDTLARIKALAAKEFSIDADGLDPAAPLDMEHHALPHRQGRGVVIQTEREKRHDIT